MGKSVYSYSLEGLHPTHPTLSLGLIKERFKEGFRKKEIEVIQTITNKEDYSLDILRFGEPFGNTVVSIYNCPCCLNQSLVIINGESGGREHTKDCLEDNLGVDLRKVKG
jgi:hypothetical protein